MYYADHVLRTVIGQIHPSTYRNHFRQQLISIVNWNFTWESLDEILSIDNINANDISLELLCHKVRTYVIRFLAVRF